MELMRSRDICTAAYYDDVERIKQIVHASIQGGDEEEEEEQDLGAESDEEEMEEERDFLRRLEKLEKRREMIAALLSTTGLLKTLETGEQYGFLFRVEEQEKDGSLQPHFKVSRRSQYAAAPLHWAVLGRSHHAVEYLVRNGVDILQEVPGFPKVTADFICQSNRSLETARQLEKAVEVRQQRLQNEKKKKLQVLESLENKKRERERQAALEARGEEEEEGEDADGEKMKGGNGDINSAHEDEADDGVDEENPEYDGDGDGDGDDG
ncbi:uncharacterized protein TM35_000082440 [Trypanosoma theileri]|uniref:Ankyrin repeat protein n=1 Tax=Trypanosoma theileri TaxID=67003 RepID=A0A1X0P0G7_9TRYP|nr:uncharacterized protein TM35_000082440 [Trypanosoma theileri]ORC90446.1 hypothetical protein TM35_000082440 [Trypanosoma theileri]